jgi:hypothetical protein
MTPGKVHSILTKSKLPKLVLAQIWKLADNDKCVFGLMSTLGCTFYFVNIASEQDRSLLLLVS